MPRASLRSPATWSRAGSRPSSRPSAPRAFPAWAAMLIEEELRLAGYGFPAAQQKILAASPTGITFWADLINASTRITANANAGDTILNVASGTGFTAGDVIYLMNTDQVW